MKEASQGKTVVRLKGGDCFVFGRGGEEAIELKNANIPFEVVPGITSSISVPAFAGIPVTHRGVSTEFAVVTGHEDPLKGESTVNWPHLATAVHTLVFLMGVKNLPAIVGKLIDHGRSPDTPAAIIYRGTSSKQRTLVCKLSELPEKAKEQNFRPPSITVVGDVVGLRKEIGNWFEQLPLFGKTILCTRPKDLNREFALSLCRLGAEPVISPLIEVTPREDLPELQTAISSLKDFSWTVFTSARGVEFFFAELEKAGLDARAFGTCRIAAIGCATARELRKHAIKADLIPTQYTAEGLLEEFSAVLNERSSDRENKNTAPKVLVPRAAEAREVLVSGLQDLGAEVTEIHTYDTIIKGELTDKAVEYLRAGIIDRVILCSPSTAESYCKALKTLEGISSPPVSVIGPITAAKARELGLTVAEEASTHSIEGMIATLSLSLQQ